jgi:Na+-translocating ferredoxin:NAD+ oxidoreductase RnfC subunit
MKEAGVVGAGGAGFPAYVKFDANVEIMLANGAECEPLLSKDKELMLRFPEAVKRGMELTAEAVGASRRILGIKAKNHEAIGQFRRIFGNTGIEVFEMGDYYPAGDEYLLVYEATQRLIPYGGYPVDIGCVVSNVETLLNIANAAKDIPVTEKFVTIAGAINRPITLKVPIGTSIGDLLRLADGPSCEGEIAMLDGGAMMGTLITDLSSPVTKTTGGYIVLPINHLLIRRRSQTMPEIKKIGQSACDQCTYCTEFCPRYLLGYEIEPHKVMRTLGFAGEREDFWSRFAVNCCECNLCSLYACPEDLDPKQACVRSKVNIRVKNLPYTPPDRTLNAHPMQADRKVSIKRLTRKLGLMPYDRPAEYIENGFKPKQVVIPLKQHFGYPAVPLVKVFDNVTVGQKIGEIPEGKIGATVHASIDGRVTHIDKDIRIESL